MAPWLPLALLIAMRLAPAAQESKIDGKWMVKSDIAGNVSEQICTFAQSEGNVKGTCESDAGPLTITGTIEGRQVTWQYEITWEGQPLTLVFSGTFESPGKILGSVEVQPVGVTGAFTAAPAK